MSATILKLLTAAPVGSVPADAELLARFVRTRDEAAFAELVRRHGPPVYRVCSRLVGRDLADDAFQAVFLVLACRADRLRKPGSVGSWLVGVAGRVARQMRTREARRGAGELPEIPDRACAPDSHLLGVELARVLDEELTRLPDDLRDAVVLCLLQGRTQDEAAAALGGSVRTLRRRLDRAKALLRLRLERRGIVPAVAAGLVAGVGPASAVPPVLTRATVAGVREFLAGAGTSRAAAIAKGVVANMIAYKKLALATVAGVLAVGLALAGAAQPGSQPVPPPATIRPPTLPLPAEPTTPVAPAREEGEANGKARHATKNFVVTAPTAVMARAVAAEAEYQREVLARAWTGDLLPAWGKPATIRVSITPDTPNGSTTMRFGPETGPKKLTVINTELRGSFLYVLETALPHEVMHAVLATHFGRPLPRWADEGIALLHEPHAEQARQDELCRRLLGEGRGIRLKVLLRMNEYPRDFAALYAQGHSVVRYLLSLDPQSLPPLKITGTPPGTREGLSRARLFAFVSAALEDGAEKAVGRYYGLKSLDALEEAWLQWLENPESQLKGAAAPAANARDDKPDLIPPVKLPGGAEPPGRP